MPNTPHFTFHVVSLPHTQTIQDQSWCAFTQKVRKFCNMMKSLGHTVYLYASEQNEAACDELITCITIEEQKSWNLPDDMENFSFSHDAPYFKLFNARAATAIQEHGKAGDIIAIIGGNSQRIVCELNPTLIANEFGIGYCGVFAPNKVFESYAWMHTTYGAYKSSNSNGEWSDAVIPNYFEPDRFDFTPTPNQPPYLLYLGRLIERKGFNICTALAEHLRMPLKVAGGQKEDSIKLDRPFIEFQGIVGPEERSKLMGGATAVLVPTVYIEPFGAVAVEAQMCGTPAITTDWGAFTETVDPKFRCRSFDEFVAAIELAKTFTTEQRAQLRANTIDKYSCDTLRWDYQRYYERITKGHNAS